MEFASSGWKHLWNTWDLRIAVLFSAFLQIFLIFSAPLRKGTSSAYVLVPMWFAYLLADATAIFAAGLISRGQVEPFGPFANPDLVAFWASFLLVHLGGPDTITAFALEDNELWLRHLLGLGFPCWAVVYALIQSFPKKELLIPTVLIFVAGLIKYIERTLSLYLATSHTIKESRPVELDLGPNYAELLSHTIKESRPVELDLGPNYAELIEVEMVPGRRPDEIDKHSELTDLMVLQNAYRLFNTFRGLTADLLFSSKDCQVSRCFFLERTPADAFKVVEAELNFFYDVLYTKATVVQGMLGYLVRMLLLSLDCTSVALFYRVEKKEFTNFDTGLTYTLLVGALALDLIASIMVLKSYWTAVSLTKSEYPSRVIAILKMLLNVDKERWPKNPGKKPTLFPLGKIMQKLHLRWSGSVSQYNMISYCLHPRSKWWEKTIAIFRMTNILDGMRYVKTVEFSNDLRDFIFEELKLKSVMESQVYETRGDWVLRQENSTDLLRWINMVDFDESLLLWHIATELCFNTDESNNKKFCHLSKFLSDYMLYLLIVQSSMISTLVGSVQIRFIDTCAEAKRFFRGRKIRKAYEGNNCCPHNSIFGNCFFCIELEEGRQQSQTSCCCFKKCCHEEELQIRACESILRVNTEVEPIAVRGHRSRSVLFDACVLAKELKKLETERMWQIISKVWVEMLSYAACHCRANIHASHLSKGGHLITLVWLLICHLGLGNQKTPGLRFASNELN